MDKIALQQVLFALQSFQVLFLLFHDWVALGRFNDIKAIQASMPRWQLLLGSLMGSFFPLIGWCASMPYLHEPYAAWLFYYLVAAYLFLFVGEIEAWWATYFFGYQEKRAPFYRTVYGNTYSFLPERNGIVPNTLHVVLHGATLGTLILLAIWRLS
jgi:hypothetical protein